MRTLLVGPPGANWRLWERENVRGDLLVLDPADATHGIPATLRLMRGERPLWTRLYGSLDPRRAPHVLLAGLAEGMARAGDDLTVRPFGLRETPLLRQTLALVVSVLRPDRTLVAEGADVGLPGESVSLEEPLPTSVQAAMRKAQWMRMLEACAPHEIELDRVALEGSRLGSGRPLSIEERKRAGVEAAVRVERTGRTLLIVADDPDERMVARALDVTHATKAVLAPPHAYEGLTLSFTRENGDEFGHGRVENVDWEAGIIHAVCTAVPPVPVPILRLGSLRIDARGIERGEARPWEV